MSDLRCADDPDDLQIPLVAGIVAVASGVVALAAIGGKDFAQLQVPGPPG